MFYRRTTGTHDTLYSPEIKTIPIPERTVYSTSKSSLVTSGALSKMCETTSAANQQNIKEDSSLSTAPDIKDDFFLPNASKLPDDILISRTVVRTYSRHQKEIKTKEKCTKKQPKKPVHQSISLKVYLPIKYKFIIAIVLVQCSPSTAATPNIISEDIFVSHEENMCVLQGDIHFRETAQIEVILANNATVQTLDAFVVSGQRIESRDTRVINGNTTNENVSNQDTDTEKTEGLKDHRRGVIDERNREDVSSKSDRSNHEFVISKNRFTSHSSRLMNAQNVNENVNASTDDNVRNMSAHGLGVLVISGQHHSDDRIESSCYERVPTNVSDSNERCMEEVKIPSEDASNRPGVLVITGQSFNASEREIIAITDHVTQGQTNTAVGLYNPTIYGNTESYELVFIHVSENSQQYSIIRSEDTSSNPGVLIITRQDFLTNESDEMAITNPGTPASTAVGFFRPTVDNNPLCTLESYEIISYEVSGILKCVELVDIPVEDTSNSPGVLVIMDQDFYASERGSIDIIDHVTQGHYNPTVYDNTESYELVPTQTFYNSQQSDTTPSEDVSDTPGVLVITGHDFLASESIALADCGTWDQTYLALGLYHPTDENNEALNEQHGELAITDRTREPIFATAAHQLLVTEHYHVMDFQCPTNQRAAVTLIEIAVSGQHQLPNLIIPQEDLNSMTAVEINANDPVAFQNNGTEVCD